MGNPLTIRTINDTIYDFLLSSTYRNAWVFEQSYALSKDADIWETFLRDGSFASSVDRFQNSLVRPWRVEPPKGTKNQQSKIAARIVEEGIGQAMLFDDMRKRLALGRALGRAYEYPNWDTVYCSLGGFPPMDWFVPVAFENIDRRRIRWVPQYPLITGHEPVRTHREMFSIETNIWHPLSRDFEQVLIEDIYPVSEDRLGQGRGLLESSYIYAYFKAVALEKMTQGMDRWANGILIGKVDSARLASLPKTSGALQNSFMTMLQTMRSEHVGIIDKVDELEIHETSGTGHQLCMEAIHYFDETVERLWNGSVRPAGHAVSTGARAQSETESDTSEAFYQPYRKHQDEILTRDLVNYFWGHPQNRMNMLKLGLGIAERPKFSSEAIKQKDPEREIKIIEGMKKVGIPILKSEAYDKLGFSQPEPGEDVFEAAEEVMVGPNGEIIEGGAEDGGGGFGGKEDSGSGGKDFGGDEEKPKSKPKKKNEAFAHFSREFNALREMVVALTNRKPEPAPQQPPMIVNVTPPPQPVSFNLDNTISRSVKAEAREFFEAGLDVMKIDVHVPQQPAPVVNVAAPVVNVPAPIVNITVEKPLPTVVNVSPPVVNVPAPIVNVAAAKIEVNVPKQPAPNVTVTVPPVPALGKSIKFETDESGRITGGRVEVDKK